MAVDEASYNDMRNMQRRRMGRRRRNLLNDLNEEVNGGDDDAFGRRRDGPDEDQRTSLNAMFGEVLDNNQEDVSNNDDENFMMAAPEMNPRDYVRHMSLVTQYIILVGQFKLLLTLIELVSMQPGPDGGLLSIISILFQLSIIYFQFRKTLLLLATHSQFYYQQDGDQVMFCFVTHLSGKAFLIVFLLTTVT